MIKMALTQSEYQGSLLIKGDKLYRVVKNGEAATALSYADAACYDGADGETVKIPATANLHRMAGAVIDADNPTNTAYSIAAGQYGTIQVGGGGKVKFIGTGGSVCAAGDSLECSDGVINTILSKAAGTVPDYHSYMIALEAGDSATAVVIDVAIHCV